MSTVPEQETKGGTYPFLNVDNCLLFFILRRSLANRNFIRSPEGRWPAADLTSDKKNLKAIAQLKPRLIEEEAYLHEREVIQLQAGMNQHLGHMGDLTVDILDAISATWLNKASNPESSVVMGVDDFLRYRGINPKRAGNGRRGGFHDHLRRDVANQIEILGDIWIRVFEREITEIIEGKKGPYRRRTKWAGESRAIVVSSRVGPVNLLGDIEPRGWKIRPGDVFAQFLLGPGRQTALISQMALHYDPYRQFWEKRITRLLAYLWRIRQAKKNYLAPMSVEALLHGAGLRADERNPKKTRSRLEKALNQLLGDGVVKSWCYVSQVNEKVAGRKGWRQRWMATKVVIEPPQEIVEQYSRINHTLPGKKAFPGPGK